MAVKVGAKPTSKTSLKSKKSNNKKNSINGNSFVEAIGTVQREGSVMDLQMLLERVKEQSERVRKRVDIQELVEYKKRVSLFLDHCVKHAMKYERDSYLDRYGNHKIYAIVKKVNLELDDLTKMVLSEEKDAIKILKKLDEVQGILLDVYM
jgi:uncharacterized protein YaaR (DUF327 family)